MQNTGELFHRHWQKFEQLDGLRGFTAVLPDNFKWLGGGNLDDLDTDAIEADGLSCYFDFNCVTGFRILVGLPVCEDDHHWLRANFRWAFMRLLAGHDGDAETLRKVAAALRAHADMADFVASENEQGRRCTDFF